ncbi:MAG TPA: mechanosensitive ion channel domain-containing protein [Burkholderiaceae bacterium]|nr:mechanosensitive ion channel domain-containing protein [Burkholderiaceae bacterium]
MADLDLFLGRLSEPRTWWSLLAVAAIAVLLAMLGYRLIVAVLRRVSARSPVAIAALERTAAPGAWLLPLIALQAAWEATPVALPGLASVRHLTAIALIVAVAWSLIAAITGVERAVQVARPAHGPDDFHGRRLHTQLRVLARTGHVFVVLLAAALVLTTFPAVRHVGASLLASAGVAGIVAGLAARPVLGNLIAGLQIGFTQPIRLDDVVIVEGEWGVIEEITGAYVVMRLWDERRMVVPLQWWIEKPFQNWTRNSTRLLGTVVLWVDYRMPLAPLRAELERACSASAHWDGRVQVLQVTDANERAMQVRALVSAADAGRLWELRCEVREALLSFVQRDWPEYLPRVRADSRLEPPGREARDDPRGDDRGGDDPGREAARAAPPVGH